MEELNLEYWFRAASLLLSTVTDVLGTLLFFTQS